MRGQRFDAEVDEARRDDARSHRVGRGRRHPHAKNDGHAHRKDQRY